ncbi:MAG: hypothetical protein QW039_06305 [Fervidicoccaceae archaeon]
MKSQGGVEGKRLRLIKRLTANSAKLSVENSPIPPVNLQEGEVPIRMERVLLSPLDHLAIQGMLQRRYLGTFGFGKVLERTSQDIPETATIYPASCEHFPLIGREGTGSEIYPYPAKMIKHPRKSLELPEMQFIFDSVFTMAHLSEGQILIVGGEGLQTVLLSNVLEKAYLVGVKKRLKGMGNITLLSEDGILNTKWDTVVLNSLNLTRAINLLRKIRWKKIVINPLSACLSRLVPIPLNGSFSAIVAFPSILNEVSGDYETMQKAVNESGMHEEISLRELNSEISAPYVTVLMNGE